MTGAARPVRAGRIAVACRSVAEKVRFLADIREELNELKLWRTDSMVNFLRRHSFAIAD
jgi:hypothetical protein